MPSPCRLWPKHPLALTGSQHFATLPQHSYHPPLHERTPLCLPHSAGNPHGVRSPATSVSYTIVPPGRRRRAHGTLPDRS